MSLKKQNSGYTLIELAVVIALIGIMLFFAIPRVHETVLSDNTESFSRWIITHIRNLKAAAVRDQIKYILNVDLDTGRFWVTSDGMPEEELQNALQEAYRLSKDIRILDIEFPLKGKITGGQVEINFYTADYSDKAVIHIENDRRRQLSFLIEPFLPGVKLYEAYFEFDI